MLTQTTSQQIELSSRFLGAFLAGVTFFPAFPFFGATVRARLAPLTFVAAFGGSVARASAFSSASAVEIIAFSPLLAGFPRSHESLWWAA